MSNIDPLRARPKVSVLMITYNHEKYIEQAVRSVMMQETDFEYELVIGVDCSSDRTRDIVVALQKEFPDKIRLILHSKNVGMIPNFVSVYDACQGEYNALCEGDDYWTSPYKLQRQVDYMEAHPECRICFHAAKVVYEDEPGQPCKIVKPPSNQPVTIGNWLKNLYIQTASVVYRVPQHQLPHWYFDLLVSGDWALFLWLVTVGGEIRFIDAPEPMSVYRIHSRGVTHASRQVGTDGYRQRRLAALHDTELVRQNIGMEYKRLIDSQLYLLHFSLARAYLLEGDRDGLRHHLAKSVYYMPKTSRRSINSILRLIVQGYFPKLYPRLVSIKMRIRSIYCHWV
jgi:glycosyltransferase involved in cell wall biosynthesis